VKKMLRPKRETGSLERLPQCAGAKKILSASQRTWRAKQVGATPEATLSELREQWANEQNVKVSPAAVCRELQALQLPRKKSQ
jgi:transposase